MASDETRLITFLLDIGDRLSDDDRKKLTFRLGSDVPRRDLDTVARDNRASMSIIWEALIERQKITPDNVDYLIKCFEDIRRIDLVQRLKKYSAATTSSQNSLAQSSRPSDLFIQHNP